MILRPIGVSPGCSDSDCRKSSCFALSKTGADSVCCINYTDIQQKVSSGGLKFFEYQYKTLHSGEYGIPSLGLPANRSRNIEYAQDSWLVDKADPDPIFAIRFSPQETSNSHNLIKRQVLFSRIGSKHHK